jgi:signal peptidase II
VRVLKLSAAVIVVDQIAKLLVKGFALPLIGVEWPGMAYGSSIPILGDFFRLTYIENPGMAFGIDMGGKLFFSIFSLVASGAIFLYLYHSRTAGLGFRVALALILGGAVGNLIDRVFYGVLFGGAPLFYGKVVDFFDLEFFDVNVFGYAMSRWPVFNIADACVTIGVVLLLAFQGSSHRSSARSPLSGADAGTTSPSSSTPVAAAPAESARPSGDAP